MNTGTAKTFSLLVLLTLVSTSLLCAGTINPATPTPNSSVEVTVYLSGSAYADQAVAIGCTDPDSFYDLPSQVTVPQGEASVSFSVSTSPTYGGWEAMAATCNGGTAIYFLPRPPAHP
jgi:hypothetical protein